ncbi:hypothetical protein [Rhodococcus sp. AQ5-07]|uniref:hypothetical protein n=1 Tax=Rhodococcus sp. AQ5-07 TaxID=2054902 RepID=UPI000DC046D9|nr:hypothetical protein [Rhodococcus sp. AQ5-07]RAL32874.1 hypothetical protein CVN56_21225 [Rhodococcus sp. AQ5-07]
MKLPRLLRRRSGAAAEDQQDQIMLPVLPISAEESALDLLAAMDTSVLERSNVHVANRDRRTAKGFEDIEKDRLQQATKLRPWFFGLAAVLAAVAVGTSSAMVCGVVFGGRQISDALGVAFISSLAVETLGILTIVGTYLFSHSVAKNGGAKPPEENESPL